MKNKAVAREWIIFLSSFGAGLFASFATQTVDPIIPVTIGVYLIVQAFRITRWAIRTLRASNGPKSN